MSDKYPLGEGFKIEGSQPEPLLSRADKFVLLTLAGFAFALLVFLFVGVHEAMSHSLSTL